MARAIETLYLEHPAVVIKILSLLSPQDLLAVGVAYKYESLIAKIDKLIRTNFEVISIQFERQGLQTLSRISELPQFGCRARTLDINICHLLPPDQLCYVESRSCQKWGHLEQIKQFPELFTENNSEKPLTKRSTHQWPYDDGGQFSLLSPIRKDKGSVRLGDQEELMESELPSRLLSTALGKLARCKRLTITDETPSMGLYGHEGDMGWSKIGPLTFKSKASVEFVSKALSFILKSLESLESSCSDEDPTTKLGLESLTIDIGMSYNSMDCNGIRPNMLPRLSTPLTSLRRLSITLDCHCSKTSGTSDPGADLANFIKKLPELKSLEILVVGEDWSEKTFRLFPSLTIPKLEKLRLECLRCQAKELVEFLERHKGTLVNINFTAVHLDDKSKSWDSIFREIKNGSENTRIVLRECEPEGGMIGKRQALKKRRNGYARR